MVGGGLAGTLAAEALWRAGEEVVQRDAERPSASRVAAGMFNPVSFRRVVEVWDATEHLEAARQTFQRLEALFGERFWHVVPVVRVFPNAEYAAVWEERLAENHPVSKWIERIVPPEGLDCPAGAGKVTGSGWVDLPLLLDRWKQWAQSGAERLGWEQGTWQFSDGLPKGFDGLVDARGVGAVEDLKQWGIQVNPNHGEVLTLRAGSWTQPFTLNANKWVLPQPDGRARLGATYAWGIFDQRVQEASKSVLLAPFEQWHLFAASDIESHQAGLRPASPDRRPMVGRLSGKFPWYAVFNGLGTRGVLVGPRAANDLAHQLLQGAPARDLTNPARFRSFKEI